MFSLGNDQVRSNDGKNNIKAVNTVARSMKSTPVKSNHAKSKTAQTVRTTPLMINQCVLLNRLLHTRYIYQAFLIAGVFLISATF